MHVRPSSPFRPLLCVCAVFAAAVAAPLHAATPEQNAVLAPFQTILDAIAKRDHDLMRANMLPGGMATLKRGDKIVQLHFDSFIDHIPLSGKERLEERIYDPLVKIDDDIAVIWTRYRFFVDGRVDHCGTDVANLVKRDGRWLVAGIADNQHTACPAD